MPPPEKRSAACEAALGVTSGQVLQGRRDSRPGQGLRQFPANLRASGLIAHADNSEAVSKLIPQIPNSNAAMLLRVWRGNVARFPFAVVGGQMHREDGGIFGGLAGTWEQATALFSLAMLRFSEVAEAQGEDFSSAWLMALDAERTREIEALIAQGQAVAGNA